MDPVDTLTGLATKNKKSLSFWVPKKKLQIKDFEFKLRENKSCVGWTENSDFFLCDQNFHIAM